MTERESFMTFIENIKKTDPQFYEEYHDLFSFFIDDLGNPGDLDWDKISGLIEKGNKNHAENVASMALYNIATLLSYHFDATVHEVFRQSLWRTED